MEQVTKLAEFLNGKNAVFGNQIIKNDSDFYFDVLTELFRAYQRAGYVNKKPSDWLMPENHEKATKVLIMILHGLRALCKEVYHRKRPASEIHRPGYPRACPRSMDVYSTKSQHPY